MENFERPKLTKAEIDETFRDLQKMTAFRLDQKGHGILISRHEMKGTVADEVEEFNEAVREKYPLTIEMQKLKGCASSVEDELIDIAVACIVSLASVKTGKVQW